ncbi:Cis-3-alkyl-4-alkyloxetan-2-one decarboxylase [subsurface metagenome]
MEDHIRRFGEFVDSLGLDKITLVVQDWGGVIGLGWAVQNKDKVARLVIMNTLGFPIEWDDIKTGKYGYSFLWTLSRLWIYKIPYLEKLLLQDLSAIKMLIPMGTHHKEKLTHEVMRGYKYPYPTPESRRTFRAGPRQLPMTPSHHTFKLLKSIGHGLKGWVVPTQLIWGMKDPVFSKYFINKFEDYLPNHEPDPTLS